ncbi:hypothetical protein PR048_023776 [Dryococelus australis]|uniref:Uncharacterized protein n=1 Tax=Dryococelus australis TaxID=614101 RepID=A0ABQ9GV46_9NEOP|nr:hypothetical protein PR048_023776 [Dryococelus australis]
MRFLSVKIGGRSERAALAKYPSTFHIRRTIATIDLGLFTFREIARLDSPLRWQPTITPLSKPDSSVPRAISLPTGSTPDCSVRIGQRPRGKQENPGNAPDNGNVSHVSRMQKPGLTTPGIETRIVVVHETSGPTGRYNIVAVSDTVSQKQSSDTHKTPYDRVKRFRERKINIKASESVNLLNNVRGKLQLLPQPTIALPVQMSWEEVSVRLLKTVHDKVSHIDINLRTKSLPPACVYLTGLTKFNPFKSGIDPRENCVQGQESREREVIRATLTHTPGASSLLRAMRAVFPSQHCTVFLHTARLPSQLVAVTAHYSRLLQLAINSSSRSMQPEMTSAHEGEICAALNSGSVSRLTGCEHTTDSLYSDIFFFACGYVANVALVGGFRSGHSCLPRPCLPPLLHPHLISLSPVFGASLLRRVSIQDHAGNTASLARRSDGALGVRVSVARIAPSLLDLGRAVPSAHSLLSSISQASSRPQNTIAVSAALTVLSSTLALEACCRRRPSFLQCIPLLTIHVETADVQFRAISPAFGTKKLKSCKCDTATLYKYTIAATRRALNWLAWLAYSFPTYASRGRFPPGVAPEFSHVGIVADDAAARRVFSGISRFPRPFIPALLRTRLTSPSSALNTSILKGVQISSLTHYLHDYSEIVRCHT